MNVKKEIVGILGKGEIGSAITRLCKEAGYKVFIREIDYDQLKGKRVDILHVNIPELSTRRFVGIVTKAIEELSPNLTIINSSATPGTTRKIFQKTKVPIVHSPVIGLHPHLYDSIKHYFPKIIGPVDNKSLDLAKKHLTKLGLQLEVYKNPEESESAKLFDLAYFAWNIIFCKWVKKACDDLGLNFDDVYTKHNKIYNKGFSNLQPNVVRPILVPQEGPIAGHCIIPDVVLLDNIYKSRLTKFILDENKNYRNEVDDVDEAREDYLKIRNKLVRNHKTSKS